MQLNKKLPIYEYAEEIVTAVNQNGVVILSAETGSGKTTQVCQMLFEAGYDVVITEPRRLAAVTAAERVAEERGVEIGKEVGFRTGFERRDSEETRILFCTDGLQLVRELTARGNTTRNRVLIIDEVHEYNSNIETLLAWAKKQRAEGWNTKVVIMSATMETDKLRAYFGDATLLSIPGRMYPVSRFNRESYQVIHTISELVLEGKNVLVFVAGKKEINDTIAEISRKNLDVEILPLHGELGSAEQKLCFKSYNRPKVVVATNVAQTSVTVPDIDAVVDTGLERRIETDRYGISGLFIHNISKADCDQRAGRAGRTKNGEYYLCSDKEYESRENYPTPEIQRSILDQVVLRLASVGLNATELEFFHQPSENAFVLAHKTLTNLGALEDNKITDLGRKMARIPLSARYARMIIEAEKYGVVEDVITITAILECGSLIDYRAGRGYYDFSSETSSDWLVELDIWKKLMKMGYVDFKKEGINGKIFFRVKELRQKLIETLSGIVEFGENNDRELVKKACFVGLMDTLYVRRTWSDYFDAYGNRRTLDKKSSLSYPKLLVGKPITIEFKNRWGIRDTMELISLASEVKLDWLSELAPHLLTTSDSPAKYLPEYGCYVNRTTYFNGLELDTSIVETPNHPDAIRVKEEYEEAERRHKQMLESYRASSYYSLGDTRQKRVTVNERVFDVEYDWKGNPFIYVTLSDLKSITAKSVKLDNGKMVTIRCGGYSTNNFPALSSKIQADEIAEARKMVARRLGDESSINESVIVEWFARLGKTLITETWAGEPIYGYVYLALTDNRISLKLTDDEEKANFETNDSIRFLFGRTIKTRYPDKKFEVKKLLGKTKVRTEEKELFYEFVREAQDDLTVENFSERLEMIDEFFKELIPN